MLTIALIVLVELVCRPAIHASTTRSRTLTPCGAGAWCGVLTRPLDPNGAVSGRIAIRFRYFPAHHHPAVGTIVAVEGGPGYPSMGSRGAYLALFDPLRRTHNVLIVDNRGTGMSGALDCEPLQRQIDRRPAALADCGRRLGANAYLYGSAEAADDLAAVIDALHLPRVDLYGDSYGTFLGQTFAVRHPAKLRTLILDSAYPVIGESAWYPYAAPTARRAFDLVCARTPACAAHGGSSMQRIDELIASLRRHPVRGRAPDGNGRLRDVTVDAPAMAALMIAESNAPTIYRELDAAARAASRGDNVPLRRLVAEGRLANPENGTATDPQSFSEALFVAVQCGDYPQLYDMRAGSAKRHAQLVAAIVREQATQSGVYAPFTISESQLAPYNDNAIALCIDWARPRLGQRIGAPIPLRSTFPSIPVLVLSGELDTVTTPAEGRQAARLFPNSTWILVPNSVHETAISDGGNHLSPGADLTGCVGAIVRHFVVARVTGDTMCLQTIRPLRAVADFPLHVSDVTRASSLPGFNTPSSELRVAAATVATVGDALNRYWENYSGSGAGLRGGSYRLLQRMDGYDFTLDRIAYTTDLTVSGRLHWNQLTGVVHGAVDVAGAPGYGHLTFRWSERHAGATAAVSGTVNGVLVAATCAAP